MSCKVFEGDPITVHTVRLLLESNGITVSVKGEVLFQLRGEIPAPAPSVWVRNDDRSRALSLIANLSSEVHGNWTCPHCGEIHQPQFTDCWKCGIDRDGLLQSATTFATNPSDGVDPPAESDIASRTEPSEPFRMRRRLQFHLITALAGMLVAGALLRVNLQDVSIRLLSASERINFITSHPPLDYRIQVQQPGWPFSDSAYIGVSTRSTDAARSGAKAEVVYVHYYAQGGFRHGSFFIASPPPPSSAAELLMNSESWVRLRFYNAIVGVIIVISIMFLVEYTSRVSWASSLHELNRNSVRKKQ